MNSFNRLRLISGLWIVCLTCGQSFSQDVVGLKLISEGMTAPVALMAAPDDSGRLFVIDQAGFIWIIDANGELKTDPFLDLRSRMVALRPGFDERGALGLAFHPDYAKNGRFFVYYSAPRRPEAPGNFDHTSHISEFHVSADPDRANPDSEQILLQVDEPQFNHNGGALAFGPDGYLYISLGDGGRANDTGVGHNPDIGNGQDITVLLGKILRIDVNNGSPYGIPPDNPFVGRDGRDEIYAYGFRNPFRMQFDSGGDHELFVGDVGQGLWEEVDIVVNGGNYGWNIREGTHCFDPNNPTNPPDTCRETGYLDEPLIMPIIEYRNSNAPGGGGIGIAVIGGNIYRGSRLHQFEGQYIFGDWSTAFTVANGSLFAAVRPNGNGLWPMRALRVAGYPNERVGRFVLGIGQDDDNEFYLLTSDRNAPSGTTGKVFRLTQPGDVNDDGCTDDADLLSVIFAFGDTGSGLPADLNHDGVVDDKDLLAVLFYFGSGC